MSPARGNRWLGGVLALVLVAPAWGQSVHIVAGDGSGDFLELQAAVTAAADGDVILVRPHTERYAATTIDNKSLTVVGDGPVRPGLEDVRVINLGAGKLVALRFLDIEGRNEPHFILVVIQHPGLQLLSNQGSVWLEDLLVEGAPGIAKLGSFETGQRGFIVAQSARVIAVDSEFRGGPGMHGVGGSGSPGGDASLLTNSQVALHGCTFVGAAGGPGFATVFSSSGQGGIGVDSSSTTLFVSGSSLNGGDTGDELGGGLPWPIPSASGLVARDFTTVNYLATTFAAGGGTSVPGQPISVEISSTVEDLDDAHRAIKIPAVIREEEAAQVTYSGQPGDLVLLRISSQPDWSFMAGLKGVQHLGAMTFDLLLGTADVTATLDVTFRAPRLPPGIDAITGYAQPLVAETGGALRLGGPSSFLIVDASSAPTSRERARRPNALTRGRASRKETLCHTQTRPMDC